MMSTVVAVRLPDDVVEHLRVKARRRRCNISDLLKPVIEKYANYGYIPGRPRRGKVGLPGKVASPMPEVAVVEDFPSLKVAGVVSPVSLKALVNEMVSPLPEAAVQRVVEVKGHHPCPCGSGKRYRDCCRSKVL